MPWRTRNCPKSTFKLGCEGAEDPIHSILPCGNARAASIKIRMVIHSLPGYSSDDLISHLIKLGHSLEKVTSYAIVIGIVPVIKHD